MFNLMQNDDRSTLLAVELAAQSSTAGSTGLAVPRSSEVSKAKDLNKDNVDCKLDEVKSKNKFSRFLCRGLVRGLH